MRIFFVVLLLIANDAFAYSEGVAKILKEINLKDNDVKVSELELKTEDGDPDGVFTSIVLLKPAKFRLNSLGPGAAIDHSTNSGIIEVNNYGRKFTFFGIVCDGGARFRENKFCSCTLKEPYDTKMGFTLPAKAWIWFNNGSVGMFEFPEGQDEEYAGVPGGKLVPGKTYTIKVGKVEVREYRRETSLCAEPQN